ncbi:hypothetical protein [Runella slithyformis]|uniref:hypothetical protein n=1 Tax=Runella slithyformis TaxID=106 RepID=UPI0003103D22|nr:hypothetical protein [Runella slithyformis]
MGSGENLKIALQQRLPGSYFNPTPSRILSTCFLIVQYVYIDGIAMKKSPCAAGVVTELGQKRGFVAF